MKPRSPMLEYDPRGGPNDHKDRTEGEVMSNTGWSGRELAPPSVPRLAFGQSRATCAAAARRSAEH